MKTIDITYLQNGRIKEDFQNESLVIEGEHDSVAVDVTFPQGHYFSIVRAYVALGGTEGAIIEQGEDGLSRLDGLTYRLLLTSDMLRAGVTRIGFETQSGSAVKRYQSVALEVEPFLAPSSAIGKSGYTVSVEVGSVSAGDVAQVTNVGTAKQAVLDFVLPRGEKGNSPSLSLAGDKLMCQMLDAAGEPVGDAVELFDFDTKLDKTGGVISGDVVVEGTAWIPTLFGDEVVLSKEPLDANGAVPKQYVDRKTDGIAYDRIIRTQQELDAMLASPDWLGARRVLFDGSEGAFECVTDVVVPFSVKVLHGINAAYFVLHGTFGYSELPQGYDYEVRNLYFAELGMVQNCRNIIRCGGRFNGCVNLLHCVGYGEYSNCTDLYDCICTAVHNCHYLVNVRHIAEASGARLDFSTCSNVTVTREALDSVIPGTPPSHFEYTVSNGAVTITGLKQEWKGIDKEVRIPAYIGGLPVRTIGDDAFAFSQADDDLVVEQQSFDSVWIPDTIEHLGERAFFRNQMKHIRLSERLRSIGDEAFGYCSLPFLALPASLEQAGEAPFRGSTIATVQMADAMQHPKLRVNFLDSAVHEIRLSQNAESLPIMLFCPIETMDIPRSVTVIEGGTFTYSQLRYLVIPDGVTTIAQDAFRGCNHLEWLDIPPSVTEIELGAFADMTVAFEIRGKSGSYAHSYAKAMGIPFVCKEEGLYLSQSEAETADIAMYGNSEYRFGVLKQGEVTMHDVQDDFLSSLVFTSGSDATQLSYPVGICWSGDDINADGIFIPSPNTRYDVVFWFNGSLNAVVRGMAT